MPKWIILIAYLGLSAFTGSFVKSKPKAFIPWNAAQPVQWSDFKGKPVAGSREAAMTTSSIEFSFESNNQDQLSWKVQSKFFPELSWSKADHRTALILQHERLHFDITELYARTLRKRLQEEIRSVNDIPKFKPVVKAVLDDWNEAQLTYDKETKHSIDHQKQAEWNLAIAQRLDVLSAYAGTAFTLQK